MSAEVDVGLPLPSRAARERATRGPAPAPTGSPDPDPVTEALALCHRHAGVLSALTCRSPADFRALPQVLADHPAATVAAFDQRDPLPPSLAAELAPLLTPRLERIGEHLRRRLARSREAVALPRLREMDPGCMRKNARKPGVTLIEKAGAHQELYGIRRVPRYDTMENRVLVATCRTLHSQVHAALRGLEPETRRVSDRARRLARLQEACRRVLARPELAEVGIPRPGERPSNALLGDADYRAVWRAGLLLQAEEARFASEWAALAQLRIELELADAWASLDRDLRFEALPSWLRIADARGDQGRLETPGPRRWVAERGEEIRVVTADIQGGVVSLMCLSRTRGEPPVQYTWDGTVSAGIEATHPRRSGGAPRAARVGVSALDATLVVADQDGLRGEGPSAVAVLRPPGEAPLPLTGRAATWVSGVAGPAGIHGAGAAEGGALLARCRGLETAVVVPDTLDEEAALRLRLALGRAWLVWSSVAAALASAERDGPFDTLPERSRVVLVVVETDAALDVAVLEEERVEGASGPDRCWVRSASPGDSLPGREGRRFSSPETPRGPWLRSPEASGGWCVDDGTPSWQEIPHPGPLPIDAIAARVDAWRGAPPTHGILVGLGSGDVDAIRSRWPGIAFVVMPGSALAAGALRFLERRAAGRPTWVDRLPALDLIVRVDRVRERISLVEAGQRVAPGDDLRFAPPQRFTLPLGEARVAFAMEREHQAAPYELVLDGPPLPLGRPVRLRVALRYTYGLQGMAGELIPDAGAPFARVPFALRAATARTDAGIAETGVGPPRFEPLALVPEALVSEVREALDRLIRSIQDAPRDERRRAEVQPGVLDGRLTEPLDGLKRTLARAAGFSAPRQGAYRALVEAWLCPLADWLLGVGAKNLDLAGRKLGRAPLLSEKATVAVVQARGRAGVRGGDGGASYLLGLPKAVPPDVALASLGGLIDGQADAVWSGLVRLPGARPELFRLPNLAGAWAEAIARAIQRGQRLMAADPESARHILGACVAMLEGIAAGPPDRVERHKHALYQLTLPVPWLCLARGAGALLPSELSVTEGVARLRLIRDQLPDPVRRYGGRAVITSEDEPISVAIDYLCGRYVALPALDPS